MSWTLLCRYTDKIEHRNIRLWFWSTPFLVLKFCYSGGAVYFSFVFYFWWFDDAIGCDEENKKKNFEKIENLWLSEFGVTNLFSFHLAQFHSYRYEFRKCVRLICVSGTHKTCVTYKNKIHSQLPIAIIYRCLKCLAAATFKLHRSFPSNQICKFSLANANTFHVSVLIRSRALIYYWIYILLYF